MPYEIIFVIPLVVGIVYAMNQMIKYELEMYENIKPTEFELVNKDGLTYVQPKGHLDYIGLDMNPM